MKNNRRVAIRGTVSVLAMSMIVSSAAMAASAASDNKCGGKNVAVANVESELLIRESASGSGNVIGYLPSASGVIVESMNEEWTKVRSGDISGYVRTDYLAFGDKADQLKSVYGVQGAVASWNDVKIFADHEDTSSIIGSINEGEGFEVLGSTVNWVEIQLDNGETAYVAAEDVDMTLVLDTAVPTDSYVAPAATESSGNTEAAYIPETETAYTEPVYTEPVYEETQPVYAETEPVYTETEPVYTEPVYEETEPAYTETEPVYTETEPVYEETDTEYTETEEYYEDIYDESADDTYDDGIDGDEYIEPETEDASAGDSSYSGSDLDLMAAIIYCEAGNQSEEGKIAVGQVVMNRVASGSFPNTISEVIYQSGQFTPASTGWLDQVIGSAPSDCYDAAAAAMSGAGSVPGALYFNAGSGKGTQIGDHQFY